MSLLPLDGKALQLLTRDIAGHQGASDYHLPSLKDIEQADESTPLQLPACQPGSPHLSLLSVIWFCLTTKQ